MVHSGVGHIGCSGSLVEVVRIGHSFVDPGSDSGSYYHSTGSVIAEVVGYQNTGQEVHVVG